MATPQETDRKVRALTSGKGKGNEMQNFMAGQNELMSIQAQQQQILREQQLNERAMQGQGQILAQAGELGAMSAVSGGGPTLQSQVAQMNPQTQAILSKYGVKAPKVQRTSSRSVQVTPAKIQITNNNITNTKNDVKVSSPPAAPVVVPTAVKNGGGGAQGTIAKFKTWISNVFARQKEESIIREKEYKKREWALARSSSRMMRGLEKLGKSFAEKLDPRRLTRSKFSQMQMLMFLLMIRNLKESWPMLLDWLGKIKEGIVKVGQFFGFGSSSSSGESKFKEVLINLMGGKKGETLFEAFTRLFWCDDPHNKGIFNLLLEKFKEFFNWDERIKAVQQIKFESPRIKAPTGFGWLANGLRGLLASLGDYLKDVFTAIFTGKSLTAVRAGRKVMTEEVDNMTALPGSKQAGKGSTNQLARSYDDSVKVTKASGKDISVSLGDRATFGFKGNEQSDTLLPSDRSEDGTELTNSVGATHKVSVGMRNALGDPSRIDKLMTGFNLLQKRADEGAEGYSVVDKGFLDKLLNFLGVKGEEKKQFEHTVDLVEVIAPRDQRDYFRYNRDYQLGQSDFSNSIDEKYDQVREWGHNVGLEDLMIKTVPLSDSNRKEYIHLKDQKPFKGYVLYPEDFIRIKGLLAQKYNLEDEDDLEFTPANVKLSKLIQDTLAREKYKSELAEINNRNRENMPLGPWSPYAKIPTLNVTELEKQLTYLNYNPLATNPEENKNSLKTFFENNEDLSLKKYNGFGGYERYISDLTKDINKAFQKNPTITSYEIPGYGTFELPLQTVNNEKNLIEQAEFLDKQSDFVYDPSRPVSDSNRSLMRERKAAGKKLREEAKKKYTGSSETNWDNVRAARGISYAGEGIKDIAESVIEKGKDIIGNFVPSVISNQKLGNADIIRDYLKSNLGFNDTAISGVLGVMHAESELNPGAVNDKAYKAAKAKGYTDEVIFSQGMCDQGICQWKDSRVKNFMKWQKENGKGNGYLKDASLETQLEFMEYEMNQRKKFMEEMKNIPDNHENFSISQAADIMLRGFENGGYDKLASKEQMDNYAERYQGLIERRVSHALGYDKAMANRGGSNYVSKATSFNNTDIEMTNSHYVGSEYFNPMKSGVVSSHYKYRQNVGRMHKGIDIAAPEGTEVMSVMDGVVSKVAEEPKGYGKYIKIDHPNGTQTVYAHLSSQNVKEGDKVKGGEVIGLSGNTGRSFGPHLHFETKEGDGKGNYTAIDPAKFTGLNYKEGQEISQLDTSSAYNPSTSKGSSIFGGIKGALSGGWIGKTMDTISSVYDKVIESITSFADSVKPEEQWKLVENPMEVINTLGESTSREFYRNLYNSKNNIPELLTESDPNNEYKLAWVDNKTFKLYRRKKENADIEGSVSPTPPSAELTPQKVEEISKEGENKEKEKETELTPKEDEAAKVEPTKLSEENPEISIDSEEKKGWEKIDRDSLISSFTDVHGDEFVNELRSVPEKDIPSILNKRDGDYIYKNEVVYTKEGQPPVYAYFRKKKTSTDDKLKAAGVNLKSGSPIKLALETIQEAFGVKPEKIELSKDPMGGKLKGIDNSNSMRLANNLMEKEDVTKENINEIVKAGFVKVNNKFDVLSDSNYSLARAALSTGNSYTYNNQTNNQNFAESFTK